MALSYHPRPKSVVDKTPFINQRCFLIIFIVVCLAYFALAQIQMAFGASSILSNNPGEDSVHHQYMLMPQENRLPIQSIHHVENKSTRTRNQPTETVRHAFIRSKDRNFMVIDRYLVETPKNTNKRTIAVLGDGIIPLRIEEETKPEVAVAEFTCSMGDQAGTKARIIPMRGHLPLRHHYFEKKEGKGDRSPFSGNGDKFRTMIIFCEELEFDANAAVQPPLILSSSNFSVSIDSPFVVNPTTPKRQDHSTGISGGLSAVHCMCPAYGLKEPHWLIEYIEHHLAAGVSHLHVYDFNLHELRLQSTIQEYQKQGVITNHDWSVKASGGYTNRVAYEHAKWAASTDCLLRTRGQFDFALFSDVDEVWLGDVAKRPSGDIQSGLSFCKRAREESKGVKIGCGIESTTISSVYTKLSAPEQEAAKSMLLLERYDRSEAHPNCPGNCHCERGAWDPRDPTKRICLKMNRKYQVGRQKFVFNTGDLSIEPMPLFTHALSRDTDEMDRIMAIVPEDLLHVRHYQGHWLARANKLETLEEKEAPIPRHILDTIRQRIHDSDVLASAYNSQNSTGVEWITPIERSPRLQISKTTLLETRQDLDSFDILATKIVQGKASFPEGTSALKFRPGKLSQISEVEALRQCYVDKAVYGEHFHRSDTVQVSISEVHQLIYKFVPKSGSSTSRYMMKERFGAIERIKNTAAFGDGTFSNYTIFTFVRDPLSRFFASYDEAYARAAPWARHGSHPFPYLYEGFDSYQDYEDVFCPPETRKSRKECTKRASQENGTLAARLGRFAFETDGRSIFDVHLQLQVPMLSKRSDGRAIHMDVLFNTTAATNGWESLAASRGVNLSVPSSDGGTGVIQGRSYPRRFRIELITNATKQRICALGLLDYCCLNLPLPPPCSDLFCRLDQMDGRIRIQPWTHPQSATKM